MAELQISLAAARVNAKMTQEQAARALGVGKQTICNWENGKVIPGIPQMEMLCKVYGLSTDNIFLPSYSTICRAKKGEEKNE